MSVPSAYTIDVGSLKNGERREISLLHHGRPCFSTSHRGVQSVLLTKFPDLHFISTHEPPFLSSSISKPNALDSSGGASCQSPSSRHVHYYTSPAFEFTKAMDYLCVFHRDELHKPYERLPQLSRHQAIVCTSYEIASCISNQFPLPDICPEYFCPGVFGVWIHGKCASHGTSVGEGFPCTVSTLPTTVEVHNLVYTAAVDLWWMISPLVVQPVYVLVSNAPHVFQQSSSSALFPPSLSFPSPIQDPRYSPIVMKVAVVKQFVALGQEMWTVVQRSATTIGLAITSPSYALDILLWEWLPQCLKLPDTCCPTEGSMKESKGITVPTVMATVSEHPDLGKQIIFITASPTSSTTASSSSSISSYSPYVYAVQTPNFLTREGEFTILFTLAPSIHPQVASVLHCMIPSFCPQPIVVTNYPSTNMIALFDVCTLLEEATTMASSRSSASDLPPSPPPHCDMGRRYTACTSINAFLEGEVKGLRSMSEKWRLRGKRRRVEGSSPTSTMAEGVMVWAHSSTVSEEQERKSSQEEKEGVAMESMEEVYPTRECTRKTKDSRNSIWVLNGLMEEDGPTVAFSMSHYSSAEHKGNNASEASCHQSSLEKNAQSTESRRSVLLDVPFFIGDRTPMLRYTLEVLHVCLGTKAWWKLQYTVLRVAWKVARFKKVESSLLLDLLYALIIENVCQSLYGHSFPFCASTSLHSISSRSSSAATPYSAVPLANGCHSSFSPLFPQSKRINKDGSGKEEKAISFFPASVSSSSTLWTFDAIEEVAAALTGENHIHTAAAKDGTCADEESSFSPHLASVKMSPHALSGRWPAYNCGLILIGLHLLYESAKLLEPLWSSLPPLGQLNLAMSHLLQWKSYRLFYQFEMLRSATSVYPTSATMSTDKSAHGSCVDGAKEVKEVADGHGDNAGDGHVAQASKMRGQWGLLGEHVAVHSPPLCSIPAECDVRAWACHYGLLLDVSLPYWKAMNGSHYPGSSRVQKDKVVNATEEEGTPAELLPLLRHIVGLDGGSSSGGTGPMCRSEFSTPALPSISGKMRAAIGDEQKGKEEEESKEKKEEKKIRFPPLASTLTWWIMPGMSQEHPLVLSHQVYQLYRLAFHERALDVHLSSPTFASALSSVSSSSRHSTSFCSSPSLVSSPCWWWRVIAGLCSAECAIPLSLLHHHLSLGVAYPLLQAIELGKICVGESGSSAREDILAIIGRVDVAATQHVHEESSFNKGENQVGRVLRSIGRSMMVHPSGSGGAGGVGGRDEDGSTGRLTAADVIRLAEERAVSFFYHHENTQEDDGIQLPMDFPVMWIDSRLERALKLLNITASIPVLDADVKEADNKVMEKLTWRACGTPIGRGMATIHTNEYKSCDHIPIPRINLQGITETGITVSLSDNGKNGRVPLLWPLFHNSCAAGLRFFPFHPPPPSEPTIGKSFPLASASVSREKLIYQARSVSTICRAGLLFTAGLLGHFESLQLTDVYTFLTAPEQDHALRELMAIGVLLGLSCTYRATSNPTVYKCLSVHILSLTPSEEDVEIRLNVQTAAFVAIGLLFQGQFHSSHAFLIDVFLVEMTRHPNDEHCVDREGYALGAGLGLGLILLGRGSNATITSGSIPIVETLLKVMEGKERDSLGMNASEDCSFTENDLRTPNEKDTENWNSTVNASETPKCLRVYEGKCYNTIVAGPAAVMALGLIFLKTEEKLIFKRLTLPNAFDKLLSVTPTMCLFRGLVAPLICWSSISPTRDWVYAQLPRCLNELFLLKFHYHSTFLQERQYLLMSWGYTLAGTILALGLRYAGTMDPQARSIILAELQGFLRHEIGSSRIRMTAMQKSNGAFERCILCCCLAAAMVMAGTGDEELFQIFQQLHQRTGGKETLSYGVYMAVTMSIGLLFLGGGRFTLSNSTPSIAALLISLYPLWPSTVSDNACHLQAFRHLYVLAVVPRVVDAVDVLTQRQVSVPIKVVLRKGKRYSSLREVEARRASGLHSWCTGGTPVGLEAKHYQFGEETEKAENLPIHRDVYMQTPCLYPPPEMVERIEVCSPRHYPVTISKEKGPIPEYGIRLQLLKKNPGGICLHEEEKEHLYALPSQKGECSARLPRDHSLGIALAYRNPIEGRLADWIQRLFEQKNMPLGESIVMLENIKIMFACQGSFMVWLPQSSQHLVSLDLGQAALKKLEGRYHALLENHWTLCSPSTLSWVSGTHCAHPLELLLVHGLGIEEVLQEWSLIQEFSRSSGSSHIENKDRRTVQKKEKRPPHLIQASSFQGEKVLFSTFPFLRIRGNGDSSSLSQVLKESSNMMERRFQHWLVQALCFYGLSSLKLKELKRAVAWVKSRLDVQEENKDRIHHTSLDRLRASLVLRMQLELGIPYHTLQKILSCCTFANGRSHSVDTHTE